MAQNVVVSKLAVLGGRPCFRGTRVPVSTLFDNLAAGMTIDEILEQFPTLDRDDVLAVLKQAGDAAAREAA